MRSQFVALLTFTITLRPELVASTHQLRLTALRFRDINM
jgi:hypothetical protein